MLFSKVITIAMILSVSACGAGKKDDSSNNQTNVSAADAKAKEATLPKAVMVRVPVVDGKEQSEKAEMRLANVSEINSANAVSTFDAAKVPAVVKTRDELDKSSSTESCWLFGWGRGYGYGYGYWNTYAPVYAYAGYGYSYGYAAYYPFGGYNYYSYGYRGFGYGQGYGYGYGYGR